MNRRIAKVMNSERTNITIAFALKIFLIIKKLAVNNSRSLSGDAFAATGEAEFLGGGSLD